MTSVSSIACGCWPAELHRGDSGPSFEPVGGDGYFEPLFDKRTGVINPKVAEHWRDHYDLLEYLKRNWATVGP